MNFRNKNTRRIIAAVISVILALAMILPLVLSVSAAQTDAAATATAASDNDLTAPEGVTLEGVSVAGMNASQIHDKAQSLADQMKQANITLQGREEGQAVTVSAGNLGFQWTNQDICSQLAGYGQEGNLILRYKEKKDLEKNGANYRIGVGFDKDMIKAFLQNNCTAFDKEAVNATLTRSNGKLTVTGGEDGYQVDQDSSADKIYNFLTSEWSGKDISIDLDVKDIKPKGSAEELQQLTSVLGTFTTYYATSNAARKQNIANGCKLISGTTLYPGEEFSVLKHITPFTEENGYALAGSYLGDEVVESFGGGICQVSTTLYNAVIRAELKVTARSNHSMIVGYVDPSSDAAIAESSGMDFRFVNNLSDPVYIEGSADGGQITFNIYGKETRDPGRKVSFESETLETVEPEGEAVYTDSTQPVGTITYTAAHTGYRAQLWKVVTENGKEVSREVFNHSTYNMAPKSCTVGTLGTMTQALQAAVSSQSISAVETALANIETDKAGEAALAALQAQAETAAKNAYAQAIANGADEAAAQAAAQQASQAVAAAAAGQPAAAQTPAAPADQTASQQTSQGAPDAGSAGQAGGSAAGAVDNGAGQTDPAGSAPDAQAVPQQGAAAGAASPADSGAPAQ